LDDRLESRAWLGPPEDLHHAGIGRESLENHLIADGSPPGAVVQVCPLDPDGVLIAVHRAKTAGDSRRLFEFHLRNNLVEEGWRGTLLSRSASPKKYEQHEYYQSHARACPD